VPDIEADQEGGDLLQNAGVFQLAAIDSAHAGNFCRQRSYGLSGGGVITTDNDVSVDRSVAVQNIRRGIVEGSYH